MRIYINRLQSSHGRGGLEGDRPSSSPDYRFLTKVQHPAPSCKGRNCIAYTYLVLT